jgi:hypothetical protein
MSALLLQNGDNLLLQNGDLLLLQDDGGGTGDEVLLSYFIAGGSKSEATMDDNVIALQRWADEDWRTDRKPLVLIGDFYYFNDTIVWPTKTGLPCVYGAGGEPIFHPESVYINTSGFGGPITAMVWGGSDFTKSMWDIYGFGWIIAGVHFMGKQAVTDEELIEDANGDPYPYADPFASHANEDRCRYGIRVRSSTTAFGSGKGRFPYGLATHFFQTGVLADDDPEVDPNHNDQCHIESRFAPAYCDIGFHCIQRQGFSWHFRQIEAGKVRYAIVYTAGGKLVVDTLDMGADCSRGLFIRGNDNASGGAFIGPGTFNLRWVNLDETAPDDCYILVVEPTTGASAAKTYIGSDGVHIPGTRAISGRGAAVYEETAGSFDATTRTYTANDNFDFSGISVDDWVYASVDGSTSALDWVSRVTSINSGAHTFVVATPAHSGTFTNRTGNLTVRIYAPENEKPVARLVDSYGRHVFRKVNNAFDRMIHVSGGTSGAFPTIYVMESVFRAGFHNPAKAIDIFTSDSSGYVQLIFQYNHEEHGATGSVFGGKAYTNETLFGQLVDGELVP